MQQVIEHASQDAGRISNMSIVCYCLAEQSSTSTRLPRHFRMRRATCEFVGAVTDISEQRHAEEKIRAQEAELRQIVDFAPQLIAVYGPNRRTPLRKPHRARLPRHQSGRMATQEICGLLLILTMRNGSRAIRIVLYQVALLTSWSCDCANMMEVIAGSWPA